MGECRGSEGIQEGGRLREHGGKGVVKREGRHGKGMKWDERWRVGGKREEGEGR